MMTVTEKLIEVHPFNTFIPENAKILIVGSFPGREQTRGNIDANDWYYGARRNFFWKIISSVFNTPLTIRVEKENLFSKEGIGITDIFKKIERIKETNYDSDIKVHEDNIVDLTEILRNSKIEKVLFTSKFVQDYFLKNNPIEQEVICLLSPSPSASRSISKSEEFLNYKKVNPNNNTIDFRKDQYIKLLKADK